MNHMDNFSLDVVSQRKETFRMALDIALLHHRCASHYAVIDHHAEVNEWLKEGGKRTTLVLFWSEPESHIKGATAFPCEMKGKALASFVWNWLESAWEKKLHGDQPDHDGDNGNGWRIFNEAWGHVAESSYGIVGVQPVWAMYDK